MAVRFLLSTKYTSVYIETIQCQYKERISIGTTDCVFGDL